MEPLIFCPTAVWIESLEVGDLAPDSFGKWSEVKEIFARGYDAKNKPYICCRLAFGPNSTISQSYKQDEIVRTVPLCDRYSSAQIDAMEYAATVGQEKRSLA